MAYASQMMAEMVKWLGEAEKGEDFPGENLMSMISWIKILTYQMFDSTPSKLTDRRFSAIVVK